MLAQTFWKDSIFCCLFFVCGTSGVPRCLSLETLTHQESDIAEKNWRPKIRTEDAAALSPLCRELASPVHLRLLFSWCRCTGTRDHPAPAPLLYSSLSQQIAHSSFTLKPDTQESSLHLILLPVSHHSPNPAVFILNISWIYFSLSSLFPLEFHLPSSFSWSAGKASWLVSLSLLFLFYYFKNFNRQISYFAFFCNTTLLKCNLHIIKFTCFSVQFSDSLVNLELCNHYLNPTFCFQNFYYGKLIHM